MSWPVGRFDIGSTRIKVVSFVSRRVGRARNDAERYGETLTWLVVVAFFEGVEEVEKGLSRDLEGFVGFSRVRLGVEKRGKRIFCCSSVS